MATAKQIIEMRPQATPDLRVWDATAVIHPRWYVSHLAFAQREQLRVARDYGVAGC